jgi:hypothetical protein
MRGHQPVPEVNPQEALVPTWLWWGSVGFLVTVLVVGLGIVVALALGWRTPTPRRAPDWTAADLSWQGYGDGSATAVNSTYHIHLSQPDQRAWVVASQPVVDFDLEVDLRSRASNDDIGAGVLYRYQDGDNHYLFAVGSDGYYTIALVQEGELTPLHTWQQWPHIRRGDGTNRLRVQCIAALCRFYINGEFLTEIQDDAFLNGNTGLWAQNFTNDELDAVFEELRLWSLTD